MAEIRKDVFGWFDSPGSDVPAHDPGVEAGVCPLCAKRLSWPVKTISFLPIGGKTSYFYRLHTSCRDVATDDDITQIESSVVDAA